MIKRRALKERESKKNLLYRKADEAQANKNWPALGKAVEEGVTFFIGIIREDENPRVKRDYALHACRLLWKSPRKYLHTALLAAVRDTLSADISLAGREVIGAELYDFLGNIHLRINAREQKRAEKQGCGVAKTVARSATPSAAKPEAEQAEKEPEPKREDRRRPKAKRPTTPSTGKGKHGSLGEQFLAQLPELNGHVMEPQGSC